MQIKVLGRYGRFAPVNGATSGYLIKTDTGKNIVVDLGAGCLANLQKYIDIKDIDIIVLTHLHFDHCSDMGTLKYACGFLGVDKIKTYMPATPVDMYNLMSSGYDTTIITDGMTVDVDGIKLIFNKTSHPVETYSVAIEENGVKLCYTSDCAKAEDILKCASGSNVVIGDACILDDDHKVNAPHLSVKELAESVPQDSALYLAHLTNGIEDEILAESKQYHKESYLVEDFEL